ncbi:hypothetical protein HPB51_002157 [Rhipicephalus microplus]|uniref:Uncharacterized protein n=1 Tax=Rhipicephalus microplus TaxID=6941 RepID=A0A9J6EKD6_RHIMP|nr:hypothetical protein HPB51_002157 [Rhipicephalus microplus]
MASPVSTIESAAMDAADTNEYPVDPDDDSWFTATRRRKPKTATNSAAEPLLAKNQVTPRPPLLPVDDIKGDHSATHPKCPAREQKPPNKHYVKKALEANALASRPTSPPKGHRPRFRTRRSQSNIRGRSQDRAFKSINNTPGTAFKTSTTTPGLIPQKNRAASAERPESPPAKKPVPAGQTLPAKTPGHAYLPGHDCAHAATRALTNRDPEEELFNPDEEDTNTELLGYRATLDYYRL